MGHNPSKRPSKISTFHGKLVPATVTPLKGRPPLKMLVPTTVISVLAGRRYARDANDNPRWALFCIQHAAASQEHDAQCGAAQTQLTR